MSQVAPEDSSAVAAPAQRSWSIRAARVEDVETVAAAVGDLLVELGGAPAGQSAMEEAARELIDHPQAGAVLLAEGGGETVGVVGASWQTAIHVPGGYALIQDLWVHRAWRGKGVGGDLLAAIFDLARARQIARVEVGLPRESFPRFQATEAFYLAQGFTPLGPRMRQILS